MSSSKKVAIIGGSGFVGTKLSSDLWASGHFVTIGDIQPSRAYPDFMKYSDVLKAEQLIDATKGSEIIVNLAAAHRDDVRPISLYYDVNVTGAENMCIAAEANGINKIIFTSSAAVYGHQHLEANEETAHMPIGPYGETKSKAEDVYKAWQAKDPANRTLVIVRPTVIFGVGNRGNVHVLLSQIVRGHFLMIGDGSNRKSMAYVENVSAFLNFSMGFGAGVHIYNYVDKPDLTTKELVDIIRAKTGKRDNGLRLPKALGLIAGAIFDVVARITGRNFPISRVRVEKFCAETVFSADKIRSTGFVAPKTLQQGLETTIDSEFSSK